MENIFDNEEQVIEVLQQLNEEQLINIIQRSQRALELLREKPKKSKVTDQYFCKKCCLRRSYSMQCVHGAPKEEEQK